MSDQRHDVAVVGGGIMGTAAAHYLAKAGLSVAVVERGDIGQEQSRRNWGFIRQQGRHPVELPLMIESNQIWKSLEAQLQADVEWTEGDNLALTSDVMKMGRFEEWRQIALDHGLDTRLLSPAQLLQEFPAFAGGFAGGMFTPSDGHANPHKVSPAFAKSARRNGASIFTGEAVESILTSSGRVSGIATKRRVIEAGHVVVAAGAFTSQLLRSIGMSFPQRTVRATVALSRPMPPITEAGVWAENISFRQRRDGRIVFAAGASADYDLTIDMFRNLRFFLPNYWKNKAMFRFHIGEPFINSLTASVPGTTRNRHPYDLRSAVDPQPNQRRVRRGMREFAGLVPDAGALVVERAWAGNVDATPDAVPVIDALKRPDGLVVASGFSGHGFALGPVTGRLISELIVDGEPSLELTPMRLSRFEEGDLAPPRSVL